MYKCQERVFRRGLSTSGRILPIVRYFGKLHSMGQLGIRKKVFLAKTQTNISIFLSIINLSIYLFQAELMSIERMMHDESTVFLTNDCNENTVVSFNVRIFVH